MIHLQCWIHLLLFYFFNAEQDVRLKHLIITMLHLTSQIRVIIITARPAGRWDGMLGGDRELLAATRFTQGLRIAVSRSAG